jgi:hypothetical protein
LGEAPSEPEACSRHHKGDRKTFEIAHAHLFCQRSVGNFRHWVGTIVLLLNGRLLIEKATASRSQNRSL